MDQNRPWTFKENTLRATQPFVGFLGFQKVKPLEEEPPLGIVLFRHLHLSSGKGHRKRWYTQWCLLPAHIPVEQGLTVYASESCGRR